MKTLIPAPALPPLTVALGSAPEGEKLFTLEDIQNLQKSNEELRMFEYYQDMQTRMRSLQTELSGLRYDQRDLSDLKYILDSMNTAVLLWNDSTDKVTKTLKKTLLEVKDLLSEVKRRDARLSRKEKKLEKELAKNANPGSRAVGKKGKEKGRK